MIDIIASEYNWSFEDILKLTLRQIDCFTKHIVDRRNREFSIEASLHGIKTSNVGSLVDSALSKENEKRDDYKNRNLDNIIKERLNDRSNKNSSRA